MSQMLASYVAATNDTSILDRALPLAEARDHSPHCITSRHVTDIIPSVSWHGGQIIALLMLPAHIRTRRTPCHAMPLQTALLGLNLI
jgi:hypothetical protein